MGRDEILKGRGELVFGVIGGFPSAQPQQFYPLLTTIQNNSQKSGVAFLPLNLRRAGHGFFAADGGPLRDAGHALCFLGFLKGFMSLLFDLSDFF